MRLDIYVAEKKRERERKREKERERERKREKKETEKRSAKVSNLLFYCRFAAAVYIICGYIMEVVRT